jgi:hypothetical protein
MATSVRDDVGYEYTCFMRGVKTHVFMDDLVVAQEASDVESSSRFDFLLLHNLRRHFVA